MNAPRQKLRKIRAEFGPEVRFAKEPVPLTYRQAQRNAFEELQAVLLRDRLENDWRRDAPSYLRRAANEAAALAWLTPYPALVYPVLFEEKADTAMFRAQRQKEVRQRSLELLAL